MNNNQNPQDGDEEQDLTRQLEETQSQLSLINAQCNLDPTNTDFAELKSNLEELRKLLEDELLKIKKVKLLAELGIETEECPVTVDSQQQQNTEVKPENLEQESDESAVDLICQFNGLECSVPYQLQNGQIEFHDAILQVEEQSVDDLLEQVKFKAYFLYPTMSSMLTCQYYLKDNCRFTNGSCRYSHGVEVTLEQIRSKHAISLEDESTDLTRLQGKQVKCLVRNHPAEVDPNLWARGVVCQIEPSKGDQPVLVKFDDASKTENWLSLDRLVILEANDVEEANDDEVQLESFAEMAPVPVEHSSANFGEWERFTKGIGSKLLAKMGYQPGSGLGVSGQGIVDPIEPIVFPPGRSLDHCIALKHKHDRKKTDLKEILKEKAKKLKLEKKLAAGYRRENNRLTGKSVFNFLNHQIFGSLDRTHRKSKTSSSGHGKKEFAHINSKTDSKSLNLSSFQVSEDLRKAQAELRKCEDSYRRNTGENHRQDKAVVKHLEEKLSNQRDRVAYLKRKQSAIHREKQIRSDKDKLRFF